MSKNILDKLKKNPPTNNEKEENEELEVPVLCANCRNNKICSFFTMFLYVAQNGIQISVEKCQYNG